MFIHVYRSELPEGSTEEGMTLSRSELIERGQVDYRVKVTNTGKRGGGVSALAFISSDVSCNKRKPQYQHQHARTYSPTYIYIRPLR